MTSRLAVSSRRFAATLAVCAVLSGYAVAEEKVSLKPNRSAGDLTRVSAKLEVRGDLKSQSKGAETKTPLTVVGDLRYDERLLAWGREIIDDSRAVRYYAQADAHIAVNGQALPDRSLDEGKRLIVAQVSRGRGSSFAPRDMLTRDDLDMVTLPGNTLAIDRILPDEPVAVGETWKPSADAITLLCDLDEAESVEVDAKLTAANDGDARAEMSGTIEGRVDGVKTKVTLSAKFTFDRVRGRISWLAMSLKEERAAGSISPGVDATSRLQLRIEPLDESAPLAPNQLAGVSLEPGPTSTMLFLRSAAGHFTLAHDRRWHVVTDTENVTVMRMLEDGELIAQVNVTPLARQTPGKAITLEAFQADVGKVLGQNLAGIVKAGEKMSEQDYRVCRVEAMGKVNELDIQWIYYHVTDKDGRGAAFAFTLDSKLAERFAGEEESLVASLQLLDPTTKAAAEATDEPSEESAQRSILEPNRK
jgi:hypothetical protein